MTGELESALARLERQKRIRLQALLDAAAYTVDGPNDESNGDASWFNALYKVAKEHRDYLEFSKVEDAEINRISWNLVFSDSWTK